jgi:hypothetical protein
MFDAGLFWGVATYLGPWARAKCFRVVYSDEDVESMDFATVKKLAVPEGTQWPANIPHPPPYELTLEEKEARDAAREPAAMMALLEDADESKELTQLKWVQTDRGYELATNLPAQAARHAVVLDFWGGVMVRNRAREWTFRHTDLVDRLEEVRRQGCDIFVVVHYTPLQEAAREVLQELGPIGAYLMHEEADAELVAQDVSHNAPQAAWYTEELAAEAELPHVLTASLLLDEPFVTDDPTPFRLCHS